MKRLALAANLNAWESRYGFLDEGERGKERTMHSSTATKLALLFTAVEASLALKISPRKLWAMTVSGEIPHIRIGRCVRYPVDDLQRWIDERKKGGQP